MKIIAGKHRGRRIETLEGSTIRPTGSRTREAIFNIISHGEFSGDDSPFIGKTVADLFCGTGAFGLEALSRGAAKAIFVDQNRDSLTLARYNAERMGETANAQFLRTDARQISRAISPCSLIFLDPPYHKEMVTPTLLALQHNGWISEGSVLVVESADDETFALPEGFDLHLERSYGSSRVSVLRVTASA